MIIRNKKIIFPLAAILLLAATSCGPTLGPSFSGGSSPTTDDSQSVTFNPSASDPTLPPVSGEMTLDEFNNKYTMYDFFGHVNKVKVEIDMDPKELYTFSEEYF